MNKTIMKLTSDQISLLVCGTTVNFENGEKYFNLPQWFKKLSEDEYEVIFPADLPKDLKLSPRDNPDYLEGLIDGYGGQEPLDELPHGFKDINEVYARLWELRPVVTTEEIGTVLNVERGNAPENLGSKIEVKTGPGLYPYIKNLEKL